jgi:hypothetical protein
MKTFVTKEFSFIAISDENMETYSHLAKNNDVEDAEPAPEETTTEVPETTEPETEEPTPEKPVVDESATEENDTVADVEIPNTDSFQPTSVVMALAVCGVALATTAVVIKKKED